jgi:UDP-N-acetylglucosamine 2-epimerase (non-hydrolysing)
VANRRKVLCVVGTRPNFMKTMPVFAELEARPDEFEALLVHTGQHYDANMSAVFLRELGAFTPKHMLGVGSGTHSEQTALVMERLEPILAAEQPDLVLVPGDVNSTLAAALASVQAGFRVGHIEAGLRSFDRTMPEELNRVLTDQVSDLLFTHSPEARDNLLAEGRPEGAIHYVGNTMIDALVAARERLEAVDPRGHGLHPGQYLVVTLHRPSLVDGPMLAEAVAELEALSQHLVIFFPVHPRTRARLESLELDPRSERFRLVDPIGHTEFLGLVAASAGVLTDSGGIQEETTYLGVPCFTLRSTTERPITVSDGSNVLLGLAPERIAEIPALLESRTLRPEPPPLWDGHAAERLVDVLAHA